MCVSAWLFQLLPEMIYCVVTSLDDTVAAAKGNVVSITDVSQLSASRRLMLTT